MGTKRAHTEFFPEETGHQESFQIFSEFVNLRRSVADAVLGKLSPKVKRSDFIVSNVLGACKFM